MGVYGTTELFGNISSGQPVYLFTLTDYDSRISVNISEWGATVQEVRMPDRNGQIDSIALGRDIVDEFDPHNVKLGFVCGRVAGRISNAYFDIDGNGYNLPKNHGPHTLHGGERGASRVLWKGRILPSLDAVRLEHTSPAGDEGFPGTLQCSATFTLRHLTSGGSALAVDLEAHTDAATPVNMTTHIYWNLNGDRARRTVHNHFLHVNADRYLETGDYLIPTGRFIPVNNDVNDYSKPQQLRDRLHMYGGVRGLDHCFVLNRPSRDGQPSAFIWEKMTGRRLELYTDQVGLQVYTGNWFHAGAGGGAPGRREGSGAESYMDHMGIALEPQNFPDAVHHEDFPGWHPVVLRPNQTYLNHHEFRFLLQ